MKHALDRQIGYWEQYGNINLLLMEILPDETVSKILHAAEKGWDGVKDLPSKKYADGHGTYEIAYIVHRMLHG